MMEGCCSNVSAAAENRSTTPTDILNDPSIILNVLQSLTLESQARCPRHTQNHTTVWMKNYKSRDIISVIQGSHERQYGIMSSPCTASALIHTLLMLSGVF